ncbi:MAG: hypothetical protein PHY12_15630 [Eubacteriales bacterium]|nr:hypothetical protein [Eubacteriales bacterium]MDD3412234.1 hypothetical protein [Eubacteriales bacterium]
MGVGKRELLEDYYPGELPVIVRRWNALHGGGEEEMDAFSFLGSAE